MAESGFNPRYALSMADYLAASGLSPLQASTAAPPSLPNPVLAGIQAGGANIVGGVGSVGEAVGKLTGFPTLERGGAGLATSAAEYARVHGRPDLEAQPWFGQGVGGFATKGVYEVSKFLPTIAGATAASALVPAAAVPIGLGRLGAMAPRVFGGQGLTRAAAAALEAGTPELAAGAKLATSYGAVAGLTYPQVVGGQLESAKQQPGGATGTDAARALVLGVPLAAVQSVVPAGGPKGLFGGLAGSAKQTLTERVIQGGLANAAAGAVGTGLQAGAEVAFRPDISNLDKMKTVFDATVQGAAVGGFLGGVFGVRRESALKVLNEPGVLAKKVNEGLGIPEDPPKAPPPPPDPAQEVRHQLAKVAGVETSIPTGKANDIVPVLDKMTAETMPAALNEVLDLYDSKHPAMRSPGGIKILKDFGVLNEKGLVRDVNIDMKELQTRLVEQQQRAAIPNSAPGWAKKIVETQESIAELMPIVRLHADAKVLRETPVARETIPPGTVDELVQTNFQDLHDTLEKQRTNGTPSAAEAAPPSTEVVPQSAHDIAREALGLGAGEKLPPMISGKLGPDANEAALRALVEARLAPDGSLKKNVSPKWAKIVDILKIREEGSEPVKETPNAVREPSPEGLLPQVPAEAGVRVGVENAEGVAPAQEVTSRPVGEEASIVQEPPRGLAGLNQTDTPQERSADLSAAIAARTPVLDRRTPEDMAPATSLKGKYTQEEMDAIGRDASARDTARKELQASGYEGQGVTPEPELTLAQRIAMRHNIDRNVSDQGGVAARLYHGAVADPTFSKAMSRDRFDLAFQQATAGVSRSILDRVHVLDKPSQLPAHVLRDITDQGFDPRRTHGAAKDGEIYLIRRTFDNPKKLAEILEHEVFHKQAQEVFGEHHTEVMSGVFNRAGAAEGVLKIADKYGKRKDLESYFAIGPLDAVEQARVADELLAMVREKTAGKLTQPLMEWAGKMKEAFVATLRDLGLNRLANHLNKFSAIDAAAFISDVRRAAANDHVYIPDGNPIEARAARLAQISEQDANIGRAQRLTTEFLEQVRMGPAMTMSRKAAQILNFFSSNDDIARRHVGLEPVPDIMALKDQMRKTTAQPGVNLIEQMQNFSAKDPRGLDQLKGLVASTIHQKLDPSREWKDNTWLHDDPNAKALAVEHGRLRQDWHRIGQAGNGGQELFLQGAELGQAQRYSGLAAVLDRVVNMFYPEAKIPGFDRNASKEYLHLNPLHNDVAGTAAFHKDNFDQLFASANAHLVEQRAEIARLGKKSPQAKKIQADIDLLGSVVAEQTVALTHMDKAPYFHAGRSGDYFVSMHAATGPDGKRPSSKAITAMQNWMEANGFGDAAMTPLTEQGHINVQLRTPGEAERLRLAAEDFKAKGYLDPNQKITAGLVHQSDFATNMGPKFMEKMLALGEARKLDPDQLRDLRSLVMDTLPNTAIQKVLQERKGVQGFSTNIIENMQHRNAVHAHAMANAASQADLNKAFATAHQNIQSMKENGGTILQQAKAQDAYNEVYSRVKTVATQRVRQNFMDHARGVTHAWLTAASPAYMALQASQIPFNLAPALAEKVGAVRSYKAIASVTSSAFKVVAAVAQGKHPSIFQLTPENLAKAGLTEGQVKALQYAENNGELLTGFTHTLSQEGSAGGKLNRMLQMANIASAYAEAIPRTIAILAMHKLGYTNDQTHRVMVDKMFRFGSANSPRAVTEKGIFGPASPLISQFQQYNMRMANLLLHETAQVLGGDKEARRFMLAHFGAVIALTGTLGLPAAGWFSAAATRASSAWNEGEGYDVEANFRHFLRGVMGEGAEQIVSRGLPQYLGVDLKNWGEGNMVPFTKLMDDRRKFEDAFPSYLAHAWGAPSSLLYNWAVGSRDLANGNVIQGMKEFLPVSMRNLAGAYEMAQGRDGRYAYINKYGQDMGIPADATDVIKKAMGFKSGKLAVALEDAQVVRNAEAGRQFHAGVIKNKFAVAYESGDQAGMQAAMADADVYDADPAHFGMPISGQLVSTVARRARETQRAALFGTPAGLSVRDLPTLELINGNR